MNESFFDCESTEMFHGEQKPRSEKQLPTFLSLLTHNQ